MQRIATRIFITASVCFGVIGIVLVLVAGPGPDTPQTQVLIKMLFATVFIILPSFALSVAGKYLDGRP